MKPLEGRTVTDSDGLEGRIVALEPGNDETGTRVMIELAGGRHVLVPRDMLNPEDDNSIRLPLSFSTITSDAGTEEHRIPVVEERLAVRKRKVVTGKVRVTKRVREREMVVDEPLLRERVEVTRVPVGQWVDAPVPPWREGDTMIIPLLEEVIVVEKRLRVVEEVRITTHRSEFHDPKTVTLRSEEAVVEPLSSANSEPSSSS
ncbi:YsnF/AvaK domain-containing protein [Virgifigura deserti]|uniref:YsnF/AvaK domain-containing protein n=1 Tax=Virgifigura deserti TaxID=2268457 RepID=UPI003CCB7432